MLFDPDWLLYDADLAMPTDAHINFINSLRIQQQFIPLGTTEYAFQL